MYRFATCNEVFGERPLDQVCREVRESGYQGIEIAPFTLATDPALLSEDERASIRQTISNHGLEFVGLHWLLAAPEGLHATSADKHVRDHTWKYVGHFINLCADLGEDGVVVFGSPKQRSSRAGFNSRQATDAFIEGLGGVAPHAESRGVTLLVEPLSPDQTDVVTSLSEAVSIVDQIGSPNVQTMFDVHNAIKETLPHTQLIRKYLPFIKHIHVNELDGSEPGRGDYDFASLLSTLSELNYSGWVSLECFDFSRDPVEIISGAIQHMAQVKA
jgi:D-psicose/D-tagatose/L-ribulose 3-epimerase